MTGPLAGINIAILAADGFDEKHMTTVQRALTNVKSHGKVVAPEQGLVNGWQGSGWGHYFTADSQLGDTLGSDYDALIILGGERATAKLKSNPHSRRIINHFLEADKPLAAIGSGVGLLALSAKSAGKKVAAAPAIAADIAAVGMAAEEADAACDGNLSTCAGGDVEAWMEQVIGLFSAAAREVEMAA